MKETDWLPDQLKTICNLCEVAQILIDFNRRELLPTILEAMFLEIQDVLKEHCIMND